MTNEQLEKAIEFLLENQSKHDAQIQALIEAQARTDTKIDFLVQGQARHDAQIQEAVSEMRAGVNQMIAIADRLEKTMAMLATVQVGTSPRIGRLEERVDRLENQ